jgi:type I restriction enzyme R subunit
VREAVRATVIAAQDVGKSVLEVHEERATYGKEVQPGSRKAGVVWHTQGSGKSITMACYAGKLLQQPEMKNPTLVVVTDRNDLDGQLFATFSSPPATCSRRRPCRLATATNCANAGLARGGRHHLHHGAEVCAAGWGGGTPAALRPHQHRGDLGRGPPQPVRHQGAAGQKTGKYVFGYAKHLRDALKNATFIGFTGTPIALEDKDTRAVFGDYVSIYDIQDAVDDGATVPIFYESRLAKLDVNQAEIDALNARRWMKSSRTKRTLPAARRPRANGRRWKSWWAPSRGCSRWRAICSAL